MRCAPVRRLLALLLLCTCLTGTVLAEEVVCLANPDYPDMAPYPADDAFYSDDAAYAAWRAGVKAQQRDLSGVEELAPFMTAATRTVLTDAGEGNRVYSPVSLSLALAMLAESTDGPTRAQLLNTLGSPDVASLRRQASDLWHANYRADGAMTRILASSLWLDESVMVHQETLGVLARDHHAAAWQGRMDSTAMTDAFRAWLKESTAGLLDGQINALQIPDDTLAMLASAVAFKARWRNEFSESRTTQEVFHAHDGDMAHDFMHASGRDTCWFGDRFMAVRCPFDQGGAMWFLLPDEGVAPAGLLTDAQAMAFLFEERSAVPSRDLQINLAVPKFDVCSDLTLNDSLRAMGVTDVFSTQADFSPLSVDQALMLSTVQHACRVLIDEEGCEAAAYTVAMLAGSAMPPNDMEEIDFVLNRPFLFMVTGANDLPLFVGIVEEP